MTRTRRLLTLTAAVPLLLAVAAPSLAGTHADRKHADQKNGHGAYTFAVIGDIPYGPTELAAFLANIAQINADPKVRLVAHLGDIKDGSSVCTDDYFSLIKSDFDQFEDPLVYTIGDNEWTDCHRPNNGAHNPLERLDTVRSIFFAQPGRTLGQRSVRVASQADQGYPENVAFTRDRVAFAVPHIVGSNNSLVPWTGNTTATPEQTAEVLGRTAADIELIRDTFDRARAEHDRSVVVMTQADMFDPTVTAPTYASYYAFQPIVRALAEEAADFDGPVYLFNGDSHVYNADQPLAPGSKWLDFYGVTTPAPNLSRLTVDGSVNATDYLRVTITKRDPAVLRWERVPFTG